MVIITRRNLGLFAELPSLHFLDACIGEDMRRVHGRDSSSQLPPMADFGTVTVLPCICFAERCEDDQRAAERNASQYLGLSVAG